MIVTLTLNPAIARNFVVDQLVFEDRAYILAISESAGGRGINASSVIHSFGGQTRAIVTSGGAAGKKLEQYLEGFGFPFEVVRIRNQIRTNLTISNERGLTVKLDERGPHLSPVELTRVERRVRRTLKGAGWLMLSGSTPPGTPDDFYARLVDAARQAGVKTLLDTDGEALRQGLGARPAVVTPNQQEAERLLNRALLTQGQISEAAQQILALGAERVVLSLGSRGALAAAGDRIIEVRPPQVDAVCPIGAGDALAAAFVWALTRSGDFADAVRWGVAAGTASAVLPGLTLASLAQTQAVYEQVGVFPADSLR